MDRDSFWRTHTSMTATTPAEQVTTAARDFSRYRSIAKAGTGLLIGAALAYLIWGMTKPSR